MMTTSRTILRDAALALPLFAGLGAWLEGPLGAAGVLASGLVTLGNLAVLAWLVDRLARATAAGAGGGGAVALVMGKMLVVLTIYGALLGVFPPLPVALGLGAGLVGLVAGGIRDTLHVPDPLDAEDA